MIKNPEKSHFMCIVKKTDFAETLIFSDLVIGNSKE